MSKEEIIQYLNELNEELKREGVVADIGLYDGAVMCLTLGARISTHDIDAVFEPKV